MNIGISVVVSTQISNVVTIFSYFGPTIESLSPANGPNTDGSSKITIFGTNFGANPVVVGNNDYTITSVFGSSIEVLPKEGLRILIL